MSKVNYGNYSAKFRKYLEELSKDNKWQAKRIAETDDSSLFLKYTSKFKSFVQEEYGGNALEEFNMGISDTTFHINDEGKVEISGSNADEEFELSEDDELILGVLNDLMENENFKDTIDTDGDNEISDDEINTFFSAIKNYGDEEDSSVSLIDLISAATDIKKSKFDKNILTSTESTEGSDAVGSSGGSYSGGSSGGVSGSNPASTTDYSSMSLSELQGYIEKTKNAFQAQIDEINTAQNAVNAAKEAYTAELDLLIKDGNTTAEELKTCIDSITSAENTKADLNKTVFESEQQIIDSQIQISQCEGQIQGYDSSIAANTSTIGQLQALIDSANSEDSDSKNTIDVAGITNQIAQLEMENQRLEELKQAAQESITKAETSIAEAEAAKAQAEEALSNTEDNISDLESQKSKLEQTLIDNGYDISAQRDIYNDALTAYQHEISEAEENRAILQQAIAEINKMIDALKAKEAEEAKAQTEKDNSTTLAKDENGNISINEQGTATITFPSDSPCGYDWNSGKVIRGSDITGIKTIELEDGRRMTFELNENGEWVPKFDTYHQPDAPEEGEAPKEAPEGEALTEEPAVIPASFTDKSGNKYEIINGNYYRYILGGTISVRISKEKYEEAFNNRDGSSNGNHSVGAEGGFLGGKVEISTNGAAQNENGAAQPENSGSNGTYTKVPMGGAQNGCGIQYDGSIYFISGTGEYMQMTGGTFCKIDDESDLDPEIIKALNQNN